MVNSSLSSITFDRSRRTSISATSRLMFGRLCNSVLISSAPSLALPHMIQAQSGADSLNIVLLRHFRFEGLLDVSFRFLARTTHNVSHSVLQYVP